MKKIEFEIEGIVPILFNRFTERAIDTLEKGSGGKKGTKADKIEQAKEKVYRTPDGKHIGVPALNLKKSLLNGCQMAKMKFGKGSAVPYLRAIVFIDPDFLILFRSDGGSKDKLTKEEDGLHTCTGNIPPGPKGSKAMIRRPFLGPGWKLAGEFHIVDDRISQSLVEESLKEAGLLVGLCDHRPEYGRFKVNYFKEKA